MVYCESVVVAIVKMASTAGYLNSVDEAGPDIMIIPLAPFNLYSSHSQILNKASDAFSTESYSLL